LRFSVSTLIDEFGRTDSLGFGALVNLAFVAAGVGAYYFVGGVVGMVGLVVAAVCLGAIVKGVIEA
jgi:hypothetical protein